MEKHNKKIQAALLPSDAISISGSISQLIINYMSLLFI